MKSDEVFAGRTYRAKVAGRAVQLLVDRIAVTQDDDGKATYVFHCAETKSGKRHILRQSTPFIDEVVPVPQPGQLAQIVSGKHKDGIGVGQVFRVEAVEGKTVVLVNGRGFLRVPAKNLRIAGTALTPPRKPVPVVAPVAPPKKADRKGFVVMSDVEAPVVPVPVAPPVPSRPVSSRLADRLARLSGPTGKIVTDEPPPVESRPLTVDEEVAIDELGAEELNKQYLAKMKESRKRGPRKTKPVPVEPTPAAKKWTKDNASTWVPEVSPSEARVNYVEATPEEAVAILSEIKPPAPVRGRLASKIGQKKAHRDNSPHLIVEARAGTGKCLGRGTPVLMFDGSVKAVEDVEEGDELMGPDSAPRQVLSTTSGVGPLYRIVPTKGDSWVCNDVHILTLTGTNRFMGRTRDVSVTQYLAELYDRVPGATSWKLFRVGVEFETQPILPVPAYLVGLWMGDGSRGSCTIHNSKPAIHKYCTETAEELGLTCTITPTAAPRGGSFRIAFSSRKRTDKGHKPTKGDNLLHTFFRDRCVVGQIKCIPNEYLTASISDRMQLLAGIIDTDGENSPNASTSVTVTGEAYRDGLLFLVRSLGFAAYCHSSRTHTASNEKISTYYKITISGDLDTLPLRVRDFPPRKQVKRVLVTGFEIEDEGDGEYFGFTLDRDGRFLLGDFTVTHNTTTLVEGIKRVMGIESPLIPSPQQAKVWEAMELSKGKVDSICFTAFNSAIAAELQQRVPKGVAAMTMHSMGNKAVRAMFGQVKMNNFRVGNILVDLLHYKDFHQLRDNPKVFAMVQNVEKMVELCKMNLVNPKLVEADPIERQDPQYVPRADEESQRLLDLLASHYDVELNGTREMVYSLVPQVLERCKLVKRDNEIDFADMIWLPVVLDLPVTKYDLLLVDEAQDLNRCQQALAKKAGHRIILCGDPRQAIYGFAGADAESMPRMFEELGGQVCMSCHGTGKVVRPDGTGDSCSACDGGRVQRETSKCVKLPLTVTRRCGKAIVDEARKLVPDFEAFEANGPGKVSEARYPDQKGPIVRWDRTEEGKSRPVHEIIKVPVDQTYLARVEDGDFVLCRVNAPLVSQCFRMLKMGKKATIRGRDIGKGLVALLEKMGAMDVVDLVRRLAHWYDLEQKKENAKKNPDEKRLIALDDKYDCLIAFTEGMSSIPEIVRRIESVFTDQKTTGVQLSSIHKSKGLEADTVFFLMPDGSGCPHPMAKSAWQVEQEFNLKYVAITRARKELIYVT